MLRRIETLERRVATLETAYNELLAVLSSRGGNQLAAPEGCIGWLLGRLEGQGCPCSLQQVQSGNHYFTP